MSGSTEWRTPPDVYNALAGEFGGFTLDGAASHENALHWRYCTKEGLFLKDRDGGYEQLSDHDGLTVSWNYESVFCNPPYSPAATLAAFVEKASTSAKQGALVVMLLNVASDTRWFHRHIWDDKLHRPRERVELRLLAGRIRYHGILNTPIPSPRYANMIVVFHPWD